MVDQDQDLVDIDPHDAGDGSIPVFRWKQAGRRNLATRRQLREMGLRPGGQEPVARIECRGGARFAWLYRIDLAKPKFAMTLAKEAALDKAMEARQRCPSCSRRYFICIPLKTLGCCLECHDGTPADPTTYLPPPDNPRPAADPRGGAVTTEYAYDLWHYPHGGEHDNDREKRGTFATLAQAIAASDYPSSACWDQSTSDTWILDDPVIEAAGRQHSWWSIDRQPKQHLAACPERHRP